MPTFARLRAFCGLPLWRWLARAAPYAGAAIFAVAIGTLTARHEMWRDEIQAWLLARAATAPWEIFSVIKYEGHPGLWHLLIWPAAHLWDDPAGMQITHVAIATAGAFVLYRFAPFAWPLRLLISGGYYFAYEYAVIARNYAVCVPLAFLICALGKERWRHAILIGGLFFLLCHTNFGGAIIAIVALPMLAVDFAVAYAGHFREADRYARRCALGALLTLAGIVSGGVQMNPPPDSGYATGWYLTWNPGHAAARTETVVNAMLPLPPRHPGFWNQNRLLVNQRPPAPQTLEERLQIPRAELPAAAGAILGLGALLFIRHPWPGLQWLLTTLALWCFAYAKYPGSWRHHGMIYLSFVMCFWMSYHYDPWRLPWRIPEKICDFLDRHRAWLLLPLLIVHCAGAGAAIEQDWRAPFSIAREAAGWLRQEYPGWRDCIVVAQETPQASTLCGYLDGKPFYYWQRGEFGTYALWDNKQTQNCGHDLLRCAGELSAKEHKPCLIVLRHPVNHPRCRFLKQFGGGTVGDEVYFLYEWRESGKEKAARPAPPPGAAAS